MHYKKVILVFIPLFLCTKNIIIMRTKIESLAIGTFVTYIL